jgi:hypothetical protein
MIFPQGLGTVGANLHGQRRPHIRESGVRLAALPQTAINDRKPAHNFVVTMYTTAAWCRNMVSMVHRLRLPTGTEVYDP